MQAVLSEGGILKQLLLDLGGLLGPMLGDEYVVMDVFLPFLLSLVEEPAMASEGALFLAVNLMRSHIASSEVGCYPLHLYHTHDDTIFRCKLCINLGADDKSKNIPLHALPSSARSQVCAS